MRYSNISKKSIGYILGKCPQTPPAAVMLRITLGLRDYFLGFLNFLENLKRNFHNVLEGSGGELGKFRSLVLTSK